MDVGLWRICDRCGLRRGAALVWKRSLDSFELRCFVVWDSIRWAFEREGILELFVFVDKALGSLSY